MTTPLSAMLIFVAAWNRVARQLLKDDPWSVKEGWCPKESKKAITELDTAVLFLRAARKAHKKNNRVVQREVLAKEKLATELRVHNLKINNLKSIQGCVYSNNLKRVNKSVDTRMIHLEAYGLFTVNEADNSFTLTETGAKILESLSRKLSKRNGPLDMLGRTS